MLTLDDRKFGRHRAPISRVHDDDVGLPHNRLGKGLQIVAMDMRVISAETAETHYAEHVGKPFFPSLVVFITSGPLVALVVEGPRAIEAFRGLAGATDPVQASAGTIRGDHALDVQQNIVHGSDSPDSAEREIKIFFPDLV